MQLLQSLKEMFRPAPRADRSEAAALREELERARARTMRSKRNLDAALADANHANTELTEMLAIEDQLLAMGLPSRRGARSIPRGGESGGGNGGGTPR